MFNREKNVTFTLILTMDTSTYLLYYNLNPVDTCLVNNKLNIIVLNQKDVILFSLLKKIPFSLFLILIKNIILNFTIKFKIYIIKNNGEIIHYTVIQQRNNQLKGIINRKDFEIGPSFTKKEYRNNGLYTYVINYLLKTEKLNSFYSIVRLGNKESNKVFNKFCITSKKIKRYKYFISFYKNYN